MTLQLRWSIGADMTPKIQKVPEISPEAKLNIKVYSISTDILTVFKQLLILFYTPQFKKLLENEIKNESLF